MHIATSVVNRIMNVADEIEADSITRSAMRTNTPPIADPSIQSAALDTALATPPGVATPPLDETADPGATVQGKPLLATMLDPDT